MKYCKKCDRTYPEKKNFCENCGGKLTEVIEKPKEQSKVKKPSQGEKKFKWQFIAIPVAVGIGLLILYWLFASGGQYGTGYTVSSVPAKNCYTVQEPYTVQVPYTYSYKYSVIDSKFERLWNLELGDYVKGTVVVSNADDSGGTFVVNFNYITLDGTTTKSDSRYIPAHSSQIFSTIFDSQSGQDVRGSYDVTPPTETRYKEEVRYRTVEKCD